MGWDTWVMSSSKEAYKDTHVCADHDGRGVKQGDTDAMGDPAKLALDLHRH